MMDSMLLDPEFINSFYRFNPELVSTFSSNNQNGLNTQTLIKDLDFLQTHDYVDTNLPQTQNETFDYDPNHCINQSPDQVPDFPDDCLKFISDILLEQDLDQNPSSPQEFSALQATEKSLYDALHNENNHPLQTGNQSSRSSSPVSTRRKKKTRQRDKDGENLQHSRANKVQACSNEDYVEMEEFDDVILLCDYKDKPENKNRGSKMKTSHKSDDQVDLMTLLLQCAQTVSSFDLKSASELLRQIRQYASPYGDSAQRLAHHACNALEARLAGTGSTISTNLVDVRISVSDFLRAYRLYVSAVPFKRMFYFLANCTVAKLAEKATKIHIIDFGIFLGLQWPCMIKHLSKRSSYSPKIRITGIEYPQSGFRPAERVEATGRRLAGYCKRFGVPFEYKAIAQKWESIKAEDLDVKSDELVIVNCMWRSGTLLDETIDQTSSAKDGFLRLVRKLNPDLFVHGVFNGKFNAPFFVTRFREALFHYLSVFDVFDATMPREAHERLLVESEIYGKELHNIIACEGVERVQRPESYKQWQVRTSRAGFKQVPLDQELVGQAKNTVKFNYNKDFVVDEDRNWMLQGWKGRTICALSFWRPA